MSDIIKGSQVAADLKEKMRKKISDSGITPCLAIVRVGSSDSDLSYEKGVKKTCTDVGIELKIYEFETDISQERFEAEFAGINSDDSIHGILLFRPLPEQLDEKAIADMIDPEKDMDCMSPVNWAKLALGDRYGYYPCTAEAVIKICEYAGTDFNGARAVVIGRSQVIGKPVGLMLLAKNATVTWCHSRTRDIAEMCRKADILVCACGVPGLVTEDIAKGINPDCIAIDVGVNFVDGRMCGDFAFDDVSRYAGKITPVPGGVGAVTNTVMASHVVRAAFRKAFGQDMLF